MDLKCFHALTSASDSGTIDHSFGFSVAEDMRTEVLGLFYECWFQIVVSEFLNPRHHPCGGGLLKHKALPTGKVVLDAAAGQVIGLDSI